MAQSSGYGAGPSSVDLSAGTTGASAGSTGGGATDQAKEKVQDAAGQAKQQAQQAAGQAKGVLRGQIDSRSTQAGELVRSQASDIRSVGDQLRSQGKEGPAKVADQAAERIEKVGTYLHQADADRILDDIEDFARSKPWAVLVGGLTLGFAAARALKASSVERYQAGGSTARRQLPGAGATSGGYGGASRVGNGDTGTGYVGGGISGTRTPVPPATTVPPVTDPLGTPPVTPGGTGVGTPPAGGI